MIRYTARVPYHGLVDWDLDTITDYARDLANRHRPRRCGLLHRRTVCCTCGTSWPCYANAWAVGTLTGGRA